MLRCVVDGEFGKTWKRIQNTEDMGDTDEMWMVAEKHIGGKIGRELWLVETAKLNPVYVDEKC